MKKLAIIVRLMCVTMVIVLAIGALGCSGSAANSLIAGTWIDSEKNTFEYNNDNTFTTNDNHGGTYSFEPYKGIYKLVETCETCKEIITDPVDIRIQSQNSNKDVYLHAQYSISSKEFFVNRENGREILTESFIEVWSENGDGTSSTCGSVPTSELLIRVEELLKTGDNSSEIELTIDEKPVPAQISVSKYNPDKAKNENFIPGKATYFVRIEGEELRVWSDEKGSLEKAEKNEEPSWTATRKATDTK